MLGLSQVAYIDKMLVKFAMHNFKKGFLPFKHGVALSRDLCPRTPRGRADETGALCFYSGKSHVCYVVY